MTLSYRTSLAYFFVYIGWGTTYLAIKIGIESMSPSLFLAMRFFLASIFFIPFVVKYHLNHGFALKPIILQLIQGTGLLVLGLYPIAFAEKSIPSNMTALIIGCAPIGFAVFDKIINKTKITFRLAYAILLGTIGIVVLNYRPLLESTVSIIPLILILFGTANWCFFSVYFKTYTDALPASVRIFYQFMIASIILSIVSICFESFSIFNLEDVSIRSWLSLVYIVIFPTLVSYAAYLYLLNIEPTKRVSTYAYINPIVAICTAWLLLGETVSIEMIFSLILILLSTFTLFNYEEQGTEIYAD